MWALISLYDVVVESDFPVKKTLTNTSMFPVLIKAFQVLTPHQGMQIGGQLGTETERQYSFSYPPQIKTSTVDEHMLRAKKNSTVCCY
jgi:hypothetical protein